VLQVLFRVAHSGWSLAQAVAAPRLHHQALPDAAWVESGAPELTAALQAHGHEVRERPAWCNVQGIMVVPAADDRAGVRWQAVSDPRGEGVAAVQ
jgi:gamma-glutamyltranspeptidase/glutathione hydrolase